MKKILIKILTVILALCCVGLIACNKEETAAPSVTLVDFANSTVEINYGMNYQIADYVYDSEGARYSLSASVTDNENNKVEAEDFFQVEKAQYKVVYTVKFNGENVSKTVTVKAVSTPQIHFSDNKEQTYTIGLLAAELPEITATDFIDGEITEIVKEVYQLTSFENKKMTDYDGVSNTYKPKKVGTYYWKITVTNSAGVTSTRLLYFYVTHDMGVTDVLATEANVNLYSTTRKDVTIEFVENKDIPTEGISNTLGYDGDAIRFNSVPHDSKLYLDMAYTAKEYNAMAARGDFNAVKFSFMVDSRSNPDRTVCGNNDQRLSSDGSSYNDSISIVSSAGYCVYGTPNEKGSLVVESGTRNFSTNQWHTFVVKVDEFVKALGEGKEAFALRTFMWNSPDKVDVYFGDIEFITWDFEGYGFTPKAEKRLLFSVASGQEVDFIEDGASLEGIDNSVGYVGGAMTITGASEQSVTVSMNYTAEQYAEYAKANGYNAVELYYAMQTEDIYISTGLIGMANVNRMNSWQKVVVPLKDFVDSFDDLSSNKLNIRNGGKSGEWTFYLGSIGFTNVELPAKPEVTETTLLDYDEITDKETLYTLNVRSTKIKDETTGEFVFAEDAKSSIRNTISRSVYNFNLPKYSMRNTEIEGTFNGATAIKIAADTRPTATYLKLRYTGKQIEELAAANGYTHVAVTYLVDTAESSYWLADVPGAITVSSNATYRNKWITINWSIGKFVDFMGYKFASYQSDVAYSAEDYDLAENMLYLNGGYKSGLVNLYVGAVEFKTFEIGMTPTEENIGQCFDSTSSTGTQKWVAEGDLPEGVSNNVNYSGDAYKYEKLAYDNTAKITLNYTAEEYLAFEQQGKINAVKFSFMMKTPTATTSKINSTTLVGKTTYSSITTNTWYTAIVSVSDFAAAMSDNVLNIAKNIAAVDRNEFDLYLGKIEMLNDYNFSHTHIGGGEATCKDLPVCTICYQPYGELKNHTEKTEGDAKDPTGTTAGTTAKIVCEVCGTTLQESTVLPAFNFTPTSNDDAAKFFDSATTKDYPIAYISNGQIPSEGITNDIGYTGDAVWINGAGDEVHLYLDLNYTPEEYQAFKDKGLFNGIKLRYMIVHDTAVNNHQGQVGGNSPSLLSATHKNTSIPLNTWIESIITIDQVMAAYVSTHDAYRVLRINYADSTTGIDFYLGDVEFLSTNNLLQVSTSTTTIYNVNYTKHTYTDGQLTSDTANEVNTINSLDVTNDYVLKKDIPTTSKEEGVSITVDTGTVVGEYAFKEEIKTRAGVYANLCYTKSQLAAIAAQNGYEKISITYMFNVAAKTNNGHGWGSTSGLLLTGEDYYNKWVTIEVDVADFLKLMDYDWQEGTINATGSSTVYNSIGWDCPENSVFLGQAFRASVTDLYVSNISFVQPTK